MVIKDELIFTFPELSETPKDKIQDLIKEPTPLFVTFNNEKLRCEILSSKEELICFINDMNQYESDLMRQLNERGGGAITPFPRFGIVSVEVRHQSPSHSEIDSLLFNCQNLLFLNSFSFNVFSDYKYFKHCIFKGRVAIGNQSNNIKNQRLILSNCHADYLNITGKMEFVDIHNSKIIVPYQSLANNLTCDLFQVTNSTLNLSISNSDIEKIKIDSCTVNNMSFTKVTVAKTFYSNKLLVPNKGCVEFNNFILEGLGRLEFEELEGKIVFKDSDFNKLDTRRLIALLSKNSSPLCAIENNKLNHQLTAQNFEQMKIFARNNAAFKEELLFEYQQKKFERIDSIVKHPKRGLFNKAKRTFKLLKGKTFEFLFGYFCSWKIILRTIVFTQLIFTSIYSLFPNHILIGGTRLLCTPLIPNLLSSPSLEVFMDVLSKTLYFSMISFVTIGFGDMSPDTESFIKFIVALEGLIGITLSSILTATLLRRFVR